MKAIKTTENDEALFDCYLEGDDGGLAELIDRYGDSLTLYIAGIMHDIVEAESLMIEAFARVAAKRPALCANGFKPYLYKTGRNLALRAADKRFSNQTFSLEQLSEEPECGQIVETIFNSGERDRLLHLCMGKINPNYREALYLVYFEGLSYGEAGRVMGKTVKQVANLVGRGKQSLRAFLESEGITDAE